MGGRYHADLDKVRGLTRSFLTGNCPPGKLTIGLPLYSRVTEEPGQHTQTIDEMVMKQAKANISVILAAESEMNNFVFDTPNRIRQKVHLALEMGLGGVHFWELGQDHIASEHGPGGMMLQAVLDAKNVYVDSTISEGDGLVDEL